MQLPARAAKNLINNVAVKPGMSANVLLRNGHLANVIKGRDRFIREAVLEQDFEVVKFLNTIYQTSAVLQKS